MPGGLVDKGESLSSALIREVKEEIDLNILKFEEHSKWQFLRKIDNKVVSVTNFLVLLSKENLQEIKIKDKIEHSSVEWKNLEEIKLAEIKDESLLITLKNALNRVGGSYTY